MKPNTAAELSTQESAIANGSKVQLPGVTDRVQRLWRAIQPCKSPRVMLDRPVLFTEFPKIRPICQELGLVKLTGDRTGLDVENAYGSFNGEFLTTHF